MSSSTVGFLFREEGDNSFSPVLSSQFFDALDDSFRFFSSARRLATSFFNSSHCFSISLFRGSDETADGLIMAAAAMARAASGAVETNMDLELDIHKIR
jgi:hypothetical protein